MAGSGLCARARPGYPPIQRHPDTRSGWVPLPRRFTGKKKAMIPLETEFYSRGFCHKLVKRAGFVATYARFRRSDPEQVIHYEVVVIRTQKAHTHNEIEYPAREVYPTSEQWGTYGWTYRDEGHARAKFEVLLAEEAKSGLPAVVTSTEQ